MDTIRDYSKIEQVLGLDFKELGWDCIIVGLSNDGKLWYYSGNHSFELRSDVPFAVGSGDKLALGAMAAGADAKEAVAIASRYDLYTNSSLQVVEFGEETEEEEVTKH